MIATAQPSPTRSLLSRFKNHGVTWLAWFLLALATSASALAQQQVFMGNLTVEIDRLLERPPASQLSTFTTVAFAGDGSGRHFLPELNGRIRIWDGTDANGGASLSTFLDFSSEVFTTGPSGLLGMAFHPGYLDSQSPGYRKVYTYHSTQDYQAFDENDPNRPQPNFTIFGNVSHHNVVTEWQVDASDPDVIDVSTRREVFREAHSELLHNGGMLDFDPNGYLYASIGTPPTLGNVYQAQQDYNAAGTILRIDPLDPNLTPTSGDAVSANGSYRIPASNPFADDQGGLFPPLPEIFALGLRHPYRFSVDPVSELVFIGDVGQGSREEVSVAAGGENFGWPYFEGSDVVPFTFTPPPPTGVELSDPIAQYSHADGRSIIGGEVYRGSIEAIQGKYIFGEFQFLSGNFNAFPGRLFWIDPFDENGDLKDASEVEIHEFALGPNSCPTHSAFEGCHFDLTIYGFGVDENGEIYVAGHEGGRTGMYLITDAFVAPDGDYDRNGVVDAADYTVWLDTLGSTTDLLADGDGNGTVDEGDYGVWRANLGATAEGSDSGNAVPEPSGGIAGTRRGAGGFGCARSGALRFRALTLAALNRQIATLAQASSERVKKRENP